MPQRATSFAPELEQCPHCLQHFDLQLERRCANCDGFVCGFCIETRAFRGALRCPPCARPKPRSERSRRSRR